MITFMDWIFIISTAVAACFQCWAAGKKEPDSTIVRFSRLAVVLLSLATLASFYGSALERERDLSRVLKSIQRSLDQIRDISVSFQASVSAREPEVSEFRDKLMENSETCLISLGSLTAPHSVAPNCLPDLLKDKSAYRRLGSITLLLGFYRSPDKSTVKKQADWSLGFSANFQDRTLALDYDKVKDLFILRSSTLKPFDFAVPGDVLSVDDLESGEVDMIVGVRQAALSGSRRKELVQFEVVNVDIRGAHTWTRRITRAQSERRAEPYPSYHYHISR